VVNEIPFTLKVLSDRTSVPKETLRGWMERGIFGPVGENAQGYPVFSSETVRTVKTIRKLREKGYGWDLIAGKSAEDLEKLSK
jgi:DNA-binding transcriptional MerR regulator